MVLQKSQKLSAWNLSQDLMFQLNHLMISCSYNYRKGRLQESFFDAEEMAMLIYTDLTDAQEKKLDKIAENIGKLYAKIQYHEKIMEVQELSLVRKKVYLYLKNTHAQQVKRYRKLVWVLLGENGYLVSKKEDASKMF